MTPDKIYMHTANGGIYYPFAPRLEDVDIEVIAHHLANRARWAGATRHPRNPDLIFYSVAEHSVLVSRYLTHKLKRPDLALQGLLHDASEAYNGDLIRPLKYSPDFAAPFKRVEEINERLIAEAFSLPYPFDPLVKKADEAICAAEYAQIVPGAEKYEPTLHDHSVVAPVSIVMRSPIEAFRLFMSDFNMLKEMTK